MPKDFFEKIAHIHQNIVRMPLSLYLENHDLQDVPQDDCHDCCSAVMDMNDKKTQKNTNNMSFSLERQAKDFLSQYYNTFIESGIKSVGELELYITIWNYEALIYSTWHAQEQSFFYKEYFLLIPHEKLLNELYEKLKDFTLKKSIEEKSIESVQGVSSLHMQSLKQISLLREQFLEEIRLLHKQFLEQIPCTTSHDIACNSDAFLAVRHDDVCGVISVETSGTTARSQGHLPTIERAIGQNFGQNFGQEKNKTANQNQNQNTASHSPIMSSKRVYCSSYDLQSTIDFFFYGMQYMLRKDNNKIALLMSGLRQGSVGHLLKEAMDRLGVDCKVFGFPVDMEKMTEELLEYEPTCLIGVPAHILSLSYYAKHTKLVETLDCVLLSGDSVTMSMRHQISNHLSSNNSSSNALNANDLNLNALNSNALNSNALNSNNLNSKKQNLNNLPCDVFVHYGLTETGLGGAVECKQHTGLHIRQLDLYVEILDEDLQTVQDGVMGEIVITTLTRQAMPLIRYRTGDMGKLVSGICQCGSVLQRLEVKGRIQQSILLQEKASVHITGFQEFFHGYSEIMDFELCVFIDNTSDDISGDLYAPSCLLVGINFDTHNISDYIDILKKDFAKIFNLVDIVPHAFTTVPHVLSNIEAHTLPHFEPNIKENFPKMTLKKNDNAGIVNFCMCPMDTYKNFMEHNTHKSHNIASEFKISALKNKVNASGAKKYIRYMQGSLSELYKICI